MIDLKYVQTEKHPVAIITKNASRQVMKEIIPLLNM